MSRKKISQNNQTRKVKRDRDPIPWRYCLLTLICGLFLVGGFFVAARQHFSSIDFSIKNSKLRKQIEDLEADKRRFLLAKEIASTPSEIKKAAKKIGLTEMTASNIETYRPSGSDAKSSPAAKNGENKSNHAAARKTDSDSGKTVKAESEKLFAKKDKTEKKASDSKTVKEKSQTKSAR